MWAERALDHGDWARACFFCFSWFFFCVERWVAFDLDTIKLLMQLFVREPIVGFGVVLG